MVSIGDIFGKGMGKKKKKKNDCKRILWLLNRRRVG
jgi:hypothetical protein